MLKPSFALVIGINTYLQVQTVLSALAEPETDARPPSEDGLPGPRAADPFVALFDGVPVQAHQLLDGRLILDDPDDLQNRSPVSRRFHGTAMASLMAPETFTYRSCHCRGPFTCVP
jgi:hypothetical protein